jgi:hypothetical protein
MVSDGPNPNAVATNPKKFQYKIQTHIPRDTRPHPRKIGNHELVGSREEDPEAQTVSRWRQRCSARISGILCDNSQKLRFLVEDLPCNVD